MKLAIMLNFNGYSVVVITCIIPNLKIIDRDTNDSYSYV